MTSSFVVYAKTLDDAPKKAFVPIGILKEDYVRKIAKLTSECTEVVNGRFVIDETKWERELLPISRPIFDYIRVKTGEKYMTEEILRDNGLRAFKWEIGK